MHWRPDEPFENAPEEPPEEVEDFADSFMDEWFGILDIFEEYIEEETSFKIIHDSDTIAFRGTGFLEDFYAYSNYLPTELRSFTIKFDQRVSVYVDELEELVEKSSKSGEVER